MSICDVAAGGRPKVVRGPVGNLAWSPDGTWLALADSTRRVEVSNPRLNDAPRVLEAAGIAVDSLSWNPRGKLIAASGDGGMMLLRPEDGRSLRLLWKRTPGGPALAVLTQGLWMDGDPAALEGVMVRLGDDAFQAEMMPLRQVAESCRQPGLLGALLEGAAMEERECTVRR